MKTKKRTAMGVFLVALAFTACQPDIEPETKTYTVTFDADNGNQTTTQTIIEGDKATKPTDPTKDGYNFVYWFNVATDTEWDFNTAIVSNITLKAKWIINPYTVTFNADNGTVNTTQTITEGDKATKPTDPIKNSYNFVYWVNVATDTEWDFNTAIISNITLKAKWIIKTYTVTFDADNGNQTTTQTITEGDKATKPVPPAKANDVAGLYLGTPPDYCTFEGWYNDNVAWDFDSPVTSNITLKAQWTAPVPIDLTGSEGGNILVKTFNYLKDTPAIAEHTLLLDADIDLGTSSLGENFSYNLTIIGLGAERTITHNGSGIPGLFNIGDIGNGEAINSSLIFDKNITLYSEENNGICVMLGSGSLTMREGSKITGEGMGLACFNPSWKPFNVTMNGGTINRVYIEPFYEYRITTLTGNAQIDYLFIEWMADTTGITMGSNWTGNIGNLALNYNIGEADSTKYVPETVFSKWDNYVIAQAVSGYTLTETDIAKIIILGDFTAPQEFGNTFPCPISNTHKLELDTVNNVIKLVRK